MNALAKRIWRQGIVTQLSARGLRALELALLTDDVRLKQQVSVWPVPLVALEARPVEGCCAICWAAWQGEGLANVGQLDDFFACVSRAAEEATGEAYAVGHFLRWYDEVSREEMRRELLAEVRRALADRRGLAA